MTQHDPYDEIAHWYDLEHGSFNDDLELYRGFAEGAGEPLLEIGCGSGRLLVPLAAAGYAITGVDSSSVMLARCAAALSAAGDDSAARATLVRDDMTDLHLTTKIYRMAFVALGSLQHLATVALRRAALRSIRAHVVAGATLVLDLTQAEPKRCAHLAETAGMAHVGTWRDEATNTVMTHSIAAQPSAAPAAFTVTHWYDAHTQGGPLTRTVIETTLAAVTHSEITLLLEATGWRLRHVYGDHEMGDWDESTPRMIIVAQAAEL